MARRPPTTHGVAVVDKPAGVTSHDVVGMLRRRVGERQVGHAGTLDPDATGVLLVAVGRATRLVRFLTDLGKTYTGEIVFGASTSTLDSSGVVTATFEMSGLSIGAVRAAVAEHLVGDILQVPPMVSALKVGGRRLHEMAREGIEIDRQPRPVTVRRFDVEPTGDPMVMRVEVECSKGTYIRSLADDLGRLCGGGAHLRSLRRVAVGGFTVDDALPPDQAGLMSMAEAVRDYDRVVVDAGGADAVRRGVVLPRDGVVCIVDGSFSGPGPWAVLAESGDLLAMYEPHREGTVKPSVVVAG
ncbi:MAG: tRNA pseudouridine synthase [Actinomycetota bacterium]|jgi:tRNA pseudouridine55 synthase